MAGHLALGRYRGLQGGPGKDWGRTGERKGVRGRRTRHRQVTDLDVTVLGFSGPGLQHSQRKSSEELSPQSSKDIISRRMFL